MKALFVIAGKHCDALLREDRSGIDPRVYDDDTRAGLGGTGGDRVPHAVGAGELGAAARGANFGDDGLVVLVRYLARAGAAGPRRGRGGGSARRPGGGRVEAALEALPGVVLVGGRRGRQLKLSRPPKPERGALPGIGKRGQPRQQRATVAS